MKGAALEIVPTGLAGMVRRMTGFILMEQSFDGEGSPRAPLDKGPGPPYLKEETNVF
jgi:hypothetical protein